MIPSTDRPGQGERVRRGGTWLRTGLVALFAAILLLTAACAETSTTTQGAEAAFPGGASTSSPSPQAASPAPVPAPAAPAITTIAVQVTRIVDGDTIHVRMPDGTIEKIRFIGVDTPESTNQVEPYGREASAYTAKALSDRTIYLETDAELRDRYGRMLAHVWLTVPETVHDGSVRAQLFNARLLLDGYANLMTIPPNVKYVDYLLTYQGEARAASRGLWALDATAPSAAPAQTSGAYIANSNTGKFHHAACSSVDDMSEHNKVPYSDRDKAVADGYIPCKRCNP